MNNTGAFRLEKVAEADFPTQFGQFRIYGFVGHYPNKTEESVVLRMGDPNSAEPPLVRIHSQCLTGDVFHSLRCDCRAQLEMALEMISAAGLGIIIYEHQEGRGIGLMNKLKAYQLQDAGADTVEANHLLGFEADLRDYQLPTSILTALGVKRLKLLSNNPEKIDAITKAGIEVTERVPCLIEPQEHTGLYLRTKKEKMGHLLG